MRNQKPSIFFFLLLFLFVGKSFAQLSDLHYLPPLKQRSSTAAVETQSVYLSTPNTTAFNVDVFVGTSATPLTTISISNSSPGVYALGTGDNNITMVSDANTGIVLSSSGLRFKSQGGEQFYVNYRAYSTSQATSLTSKGRAAMGSEFRWGGIPQSRSGNVNNSTSLGIMATEDNTTVTISDYDPNSVFRLGANASGITDDTMTITLNANESYVVEAVVDQTDNNLEGWLGASVSSDKDIVISNGGLNYSVLPDSDIRDAGIDQPVPVDLLGKEYIFVRGNGSNSLEFAIILATENSTDIFVGNNSTAVATIDAGEYYKVDGSNYSGTSAGANMYVRTSKNAYAYQTNAGTDSGANIGMNFIAPVSCLLPDSLNNISDISNIAGLSFTSGITIIASTASPDNDIVVTDGTGVVTKPASQAVAGNSDWKTFYVSGLSGSVNVTSTSSVAVGFFGSSGSRSVAGYFSGFDNVSDVNVAITGDVCLPGASLTVTNSGDYQSFQWFLNGEEIVGATTDTLNPTEAGDYFVRVSKSNCDYDSQTTSVYYCNPDIYVRKTADTNTIDDGDTVNFTIRVQNLGNAPVTNLVVTDVLPAGLTLVNATPSTGSWSNPNWTIGTLNSGVVQTLVIEATADYIVGNDGSSINITNTVSHTQDQTDSNASTDDLSETIQVSNNTLLNLPSFTSSNTASFAENGTGTVLDVNANNGDGGGSDAGITYSLASGGDNDLFSIDANTGVLTFQSAPDFESPNDANTDNNYQITVIALDSDGSSNQSITVSVTNLDDTATITDFSPKTAGNGETITISGSNFTGTTSVLFGGTAATSFNVDSDNQITAVVGTGFSGDLTVVNPLGNATATDFTFINLLQEDGSPTQWAHTDGDYGFYYDIPNPVYFKAPEGMYIQLVTEALGNSYTIESGLNEIPDVEEYLKSVGLNVDAKGWGGIFYKHSDGSNGCCDWSYWVKQHYAIAYRLPPTIDSFTPNSALKEGTVTITGTNFLGTTSVTFGGVDATSFTIDSATQITATVGTGASGNVAVTTSGGTGTLSGFTHNFIPVFTNPTAPFEVSFEENNTASVANIDANDGAGSLSDAEITYALAAGGDNDLFNIDEASGILTFISPPDYENPTDANTDNTYEVSITATASGGDNSMDLDVMVTDKDEIAPNGYDVEIDQDFINPDNVAAVSFTFTDAEVGATYDYTFSSDGGGTDVTGTGTITTATDQISNIDLSGLEDGIVTLSVTLSDNNGNEGDPVTEDIEKDTTAPNGYTVAINQNPIDADNENTASFTFADAEVGATFKYTFSSDGGGTNVTGTGTIATATDQISSIDLSGLGDGTITLSVTLTDNHGNEGTPSIGTALKITASDTVLEIDPASHTGTITLSDNRFVSVYLAPICLDIDMTFLGVEIDANSSAGGQIILGLYHNNNLVYQTSPLSITGGVDETLGEYIAPGTVELTENNNYSVGLIYDGPDYLYLKTSNAVVHNGVATFQTDYSYFNTTTVYPNLPDPIAVTGAWAFNVALTIEGAMDWDNADCDNDNLLNSAELTAGTDPYISDTDGDGIQDGQEVNVDGTDPLDDCDSIGGTPLAGGDCDSDGTINEEDDFPFDPTEDTDTDGDGIGDNADTDDDNDLLLDGEDPNPIEDTQTTAPSLTLPATDGTSYDNLTINYYVPEAPLASSVQLIFSSAEDSNSPITLQLQNPLKDELNTIVVDAKNLASASEVVSASSSSLVNGIAYDITLVYQDALGNPSAQTTNTNHTIITDLEFTHITMTSDNPSSELAREGDRVSVEFGFNRPVDEVVLSIFNTNIVFDDSALIGENTYLGWVEVSGTTSEGPVGFTLTANPSTDNLVASATTDGSAVTIDTTGPQPSLVIDESLYLEPFTIQLRFSEPVFDLAPFPVMIAPDGNGQPMANLGALQEVTPGLVYNIPVTPLIPGELVFFNDMYGIARDEAGNDTEPLGFVNGTYYDLDSDNDGIGDSTDTDDDNDGTPDTEDAFPLDDSEDTDTDGDGIGDNADDDDDNDGTPDNEDAFPLDDSEDTDTDGDGIGDNADDDDDNDGTPDSADAFPLNDSEDTDTDGDGTGDNSDNDIDGDGIPNDEDVYPSGEITDSDNDGVPDAEDAFPNDPNESVDSDGDGIGDNADTDDDNDGTPDTEDDFPWDASEDTDTDGDGIGNNADTDDDNDGTPDTEDAFPQDSTEDSDNDGDGVGDNGDDDDDNDGVPDDSDDFPTDSEPSIIPAQAFTPNGDGNNDTWIVPGIENYPNNVVKVFNRYGHEVFAAQSYHNDWGGIYKDRREKLPAGSYLYTIDLGDGSTPIQGWIFINY